MIYSEVGNDMHPLDPLQNKTLTHGCLNIETTLAERLVSPGHIIIVSSFLQHDVHEVNA